jgi:hypothetical protein
MHPREVTDVLLEIVRGRRWLNELVDDARASGESIAKRERCSVRQVNMTISLAFLAPDLVKAAIEATRHRRHPIARCASRVVSPTSDARAVMCLFLTSRRFGGEIRHEQGRDQRRYR